MSWSHELTGEDKRFNDAVRASYPGKCLFLDRCLYRYRNSLSSYA